MQYKVGDIIVSASNSSYVGEITYISKEEDVVKHRCRKTGTEYEKSYFGFQCRYMSVEERLEKDKEFCRENIDMHQQVMKLERERDEAKAEVEQLRSERQKAIDAELITSDGWWSTQYKMLQQELDEARAEVERLQGVLDAIDKVCVVKDAAHIRVESLAEALGDALRERDEARMVIRGLESKIADYERRSEANAEIANQARAEAAHEREVANEHLARRHDAERERDEAQREVKRLRELLDGYSTGEG